MRTLVCVAFVAGCNGGGQVPTDAATADSSTTHDAPPDGPVAVCPVRTAPVGQPEGDVPLSAVHNGDYQLSSQLDVEALAGIRVITGELRVSSPTFDVLALPDLEIVGGNFFINDAAAGRITEISLPALESVGGTIEWSSANAAITDLSRLDSSGFDLHLVVGTVPAHIPCLRTIENVLGVLGSGQSTTVTFDRLRSIGGGIRIFDNAQLMAVALPALETVGRIEVRDNPQLAAFTTPALVQAGETIVRGSALAQLDFSNLETATSLALSELGDVPAFSNLTSTGNLVIGRSAATTLQFPLLTSATVLFIHDNPQLTSIAFPSLTTLTGSGAEFGGVTNNPMLPTCQAVALAQQVMRMFTISGNDDSATCN